jgi:hypothetical protein
MIKIRNDTDAETENKDNIIIDICEFIITIINMRFVPLDLNLQLEASPDFTRFKKNNIFDKYLMDHIKIYNPSPCKTAIEMEEHMNDIYATKYKEKYSFYSFSNDIQVYYYSIFYKINTMSFLNPSDQKILNLLDDFDLHQCLMMNSMFEGNDPYKYGKFLRILNEILFPEPQVAKTTIICFVNHSKIMVDAMFDFLHKFKLFESSMTATLPPPKKGTAQNINVDTYESQYVKYENVSFYTKQKQDIKYINLILENFDSISHA